MVTFTMDTYQTPSRLHRGTQRRIEAETAATGVASTEHAEQGGFADLSGRGKWDLVPSEQGGR